MASPRCPEPKPLFIVFLAAAGAIGSCADALFFPVLWSYQLPHGASVGLAAAFSVAVVPWSWARLVVAPLAGLASFLALGAILTHLREPELYRMETSWFQVVAGLSLGAMPGLLFALAHDLFLRSLKFLPVYLLAGALCGSVQLNWQWQLDIDLFPVGGWRIDFDPLGLSTGATFGLAQLAGMAVALALDRRMSTRGLEKLDRLS